MDSRNAIDARAAAIMVVLCVIWGLQQTVLKLAAPDIAPVMQLALRSGVAALLVGVLMLWRRERIVLSDGRWQAGLLAGCLFALEFLCIAQGIRYTTASHAVVFLYTAPIFAALGLHFKLPSERLDGLQWSGIGLAFAGIALAFFAGDAASAPTVELANMLLGDALALAGGILWAATTVVIRCSSLSRASAAQTLLYQLVSAFALLLAAAFASGQTHFDATPRAFAAIAFQSVIVAFASFLVWFWLLRHYLAARLGVFSFMTPLFGVGFGMWLLGDTLESHFLAGASLVLAGVTLVSNHNGLTQWLKRRKTGSRPTFEKEDL
jgi:drug/metabolite transporter (DMT)-like permease